MLSRPGNRSAFTARGCEVRYASIKVSGLTCVYICVVVTEAWPSSSCTVRTSAPPWIRCVAKECRSVCG